MSLIMHETVAPHIARLTLNRAEARNALSRALVAEFRESLAALSYERNLRTLIIAGTRESSAFCAGADLVERTGLTPAERMEHLHAISALCEELAAFPTPTIAELHGYVLAGGCELALACDIRIAADDSTFGLPEVAVGLFPGAGGVTRLPKLVGAGKARELMLSARRISATEAAAIGLIERVVPLVDLSGSAEELANQISANAPLAVRALKRALAASDNLPIEAATAAVLAERMPLDQTRDYLEGITAFKEKRKPVYRGE
jgi:enoyl-CoA hydratase/carnithine racemase